MDEQKQIAYGSASERRKKLLAEKPECPNINCSEPWRVMLVNQFLIPAVWKCKACEGEFTHEPI